MDKKRLFVYIDEAQWFKRYLFLSELMPRVFFLVFMAASPLVVQGKVGSLRDFCTMLAMDG